MTTFLMFFFIEALHTAIVSTDWAFIPPHSNTADRTKRNDLKCFILQQVCFIGRSQFHNDGLFRNGKDRSTKIGKGKRSGKMKTKFSTLTLPSRILSYPKIRKVDGQTEYSRGGFTERFLDYSKTDYKGGKERFCSIKTVHTKGRKAQCLPSFCMNDITLEVVILPTKDPSPGREAPLRKRRTDRAFRPLPGTTVPVPRLGVRPSRLPYSGRPSAW